MIITGIDPDLSGGLATINTQTKEVIHLHRMPVFEHPVSGVKIIRVEEVHRLLLMARAAGSVMLILEAASLRPGQGNGGRIMTHYGMLLALGHLVFTRAGTLVAQPSKWKRKLKLSSDKNLSLDLATQYCPAHSSLLSKKKNVGIAEAILMCYWAADHELKCTGG